MTKNEYKQFLNAEVYKNLDIRGIHNTFSRWLAIYMEPKLNALYNIRKMNYLTSFSKANIFYRFNRFRSKMIKRKLITRYGIHISPKAKIGMGLSIAHPTSIVIGESVKIGKNFTIFQNTTIGSARTGDSKLGKQPAIGDNCILFAGGIILGNIKVGDNCIIGANSLLMSDAEDNGVYVGSPARLVKTI